MNKSLLATALLLSSFVGANADTLPISGALNAGYDSTYSYNNVVLNYGETGVKEATWGGIDLRYSIPSTLDVVAGFSKTNISQNNDYGLKLDVDPDDDYTDLDTLGFKDQSMLYVGVEGQKWEGVTTYVGYKLYQGGLPGLFAQNRKDFKNADPDAVTHPLASDAMEHLIEASIAYNCPNCGFFAKAYVAQSVSGTEGTLINLTSGYGWDFAENVQFIVSGNVSFSQKYMAIEGDRFSGTDGYSITASLPIKATKNVTITPYISNVWAGHNPIAMNSYYRMTENSNRCFDNYTLIGGVSVSWTF